MKHPRPFPFAIIAVLALSPAGQGRLAAQDSANAPAGVAARQQPAATAPPRQDSARTGQDPASPGTEPRRQPVVAPTLPGPRIGPGIVPGGVAGPDRRQRGAVVPPLAGRTLEEARVLLADRGLELGAVGELATAREPGTVVLQRPAAGETVPRGTAVSVQVSRGRVALATVPPLQDQTMDGAAALLERAGLRTGRVSGARGDPDARVERQSPRAGESVPPGSTVDLLLMAAPAAPGPVAAADPAQDREREAEPVPGPQPETSVQPAPAATPAAPLPPRGGDSAGVPDVRGLRLDGAIDRLAQAGLVAELDASSPDSAHWRVAEQAPAPGAGFGAGGSVRLVLAAPPVELPPAAAPVVPVRPGRDWGRMGGGAAIALLLLAAGAAMRRGPRRAAPAGPVRARTRAAAAPRVRVEGTPFGGARVGLRPRTAAPAAAVSPGPLFTHKEAARG